MRTQLFYSKKGDHYLVKVGNPFAEPLKIDANTFTKLLRKHGRSLNGDVSLSGSIHIDAEELSAL